MRARLLALAALVSAAGAGSLVFVNWDTGQLDAPVPGAFEVMDKNSCTVAACGALACVQANDVLADAGSACASRLVTCDVRVGPRARDWATDAGLVLGPQKYQRLRFVGMRCPGADGGSSFGVPLDDIGLPQFSSLSVVPPGCVRAPLDAGLDCRRDEHDGGSRFFGAGNVFPTGDAVGTQCEPVQCTVMFGDNPDTDL